MSWINYDDVLNQLSLLEIDASQLSFDGRIQRWKEVGGDREKRGWTKLREWTSKAGHTYIVGCWGVWRGPDDGYTKIEMPKKADDRPALTADDIAAIRAAQKEAAKKVAEVRKAEAKKAAQWAAMVWSKSEPAPADHDYLVKKQIQPNGTRVLQQVDGTWLDGMGLDDSNLYRLKSAVGALVVPMHDEHGNVCGIQFIYPRGHERAKKIERDKEFWPSGMAMGGTFGMIGHVKRDGILLIAEGFATAATLHEATGQTVAYAFSANNLVKAGKLIRKTAARARLLFCADDDYLSEGNPGLTYAAQASAEIEGSAWTYPDFKDDQGGDRREGKKLTDYNDLAILTGIPLTVANQINAALDKLKWKDPSPAAAGAGGNSQGGGGNTDDPQGRRRAEAVMPLDDIVARFIPLDDGTGKYVFDTWTNKVASREQMIALLPAGVRGDDIKRHPVFIERGAYYLDQVGFDPSGNDRGVKLNTWKGWPMQPKAGSCERMLELLRYLCSGEGEGEAREKKTEEIYHWLLCWLAYPLQNPGAKMSSAVIMHGPQGTGKSTIFQAVAKIYGDYATVLNQRGLEDKFNSDWADSKLFILAEEVVTRAEMWHIKNELKELVTGEWIRVNPKNIAAYRQRNHVNIIYLSNEHQPLPLENDDRRHLVVWTPPQLGDDYYDEVFLEIEKGGVEAFYQYLLNLDLTGFHPKKKPPMTEAKRELIDLSLPSEDRFIRDWLAGDTEYPLVPCASMDLYTAYNRWCRANGVKNPRESNQFLGKLSKLPGWSNQPRHIHEDCHCTGSTKPKRIVIPPRDRLQSAKTDQPPGMSQAAWLTGSYFKFSESLGGNQ
jgi:putative DNA primase/helicase